MRLPVDYRLWQQKPFLILLCFFWMNATKFHGCFGDWWLPCLMLHLDRLSAQRVYSAHTIFEDKIAIGPSSNYAPLGIKTGASKVGLRRKLGSALFHFTPIARKGRQFLLCGMLTRVLVSTSRQKIFWFVSFIRYARTERLFNSCCSQKVLSFWNSMTRSLHGEFRMPLALGIQWSLVANLH